LPLEKVMRAILFVLKEGCGWRAIDQPEAKWNSVYQYYRRWCRQGTWQKLWDMLAPPTRGRAAFLDSSHIKVHRSGLNPAGGREAQAIGKTKGGWNTKLHAMVDGSGVPLALFLSPGNEADVSHATALLEGTTAGKVVADKGYDSDSLRSWLGQRGIISCIPPRSNRIAPKPYSRALYRKRHLVENFFGAIKILRRVATRYDKLAETFFGWVLLAVIVKFGT
jgi:transposase